MKTGSFPLTIKEQGQEKFESQVMLKFIQRGQFYYSLKENSQGRLTINLRSYQEENGEERNDVMFELRQHEEQSHGGEWGFR